MLSLAGKRALVTGAGVRVGRAIADHLVDLGAEVAFHHQGSREGAEAGVARARERGQLAVALGADLRDPAATRALPGQTVEALGSLDLLVNSAATFERLPFEAIGDDALLRMVELDFLAPFRLCQASFPWLRATRGSIVNILDIAVERPWPGYAHYCAAKGALWTLTEQLALELAPEVRVNGVAPGTVLWPEGDPQGLAREVSRIPLRRSGTPGDVAGAVAFLASSDFVTGTVLRVDGGRAL